MRSSSLSLSLALALSVVGSGCLAQPGEVTVVRAGKIITLAGPPIEDGLIVIESGKIVAMGRYGAVKIPPGAKTVDARSRIVMPGLVAAYSTLAGESEYQESISPDIRAVDGFDFFADNQRLLQGGLTTAYIATGNRRLISGQGAVVKIAGAGAASRTLAAAADVRVALGAFSKNPPAIFRPALPPTTDNPLLPAQRQLASARPAEFAMLRQVFADARADQAHPATPVHTVGVGASDASSHLAERRLKLGPIIEIVRGKRPLRVHADTVADIRLALQFAADEKIGIVIEGAAEGGRIAAEIAARHVPVVASSPVITGATVTSDFDRPGAAGKQSVYNLKQLINAGVTVALMPQGDDVLPNLLTAAAAQTAYGVSPDSALRSITVNAAQILGLSSRIGSLAVGKDADMIILSGSPLASATHIESVMVNGRVAYTRSAPSGGGDLVAIRAGRIYTVSHGIIEHGVVLIRGDKIAGINADGIVPPGARVIDASNSCIIPGMIDGYTHLGLHADAEPAPVDPAPPDSGPASGRTNLVSAIRSDDPSLAEALDSGVTAVLIAPPPSGAVCGAASLIKPIPAGDAVNLANPRVVREVAAVCFNLQGGAPRMSQPWVFEGLLQSAKAYNTRRIQYVRDEKQWEFDRDAATKQHKPPPAEPAEVARDDDQEPFAALFRGEIPAMVHVSRSDEILTALKVFKDENGLPLVLEGAGDSYHVSEEIRKRNVEVALGPEITRRDHGAEISLPEALSSAGVQVLLEGSSSSGTQFLRLNAANAVRSGMDPAEALRAITLAPARALHVEQRLGSIDIGKDADLVIMSGEPMELTSRVEKVLVNGKVVYDGHAER